jgi:hypothetical protein
MYQGIALPRKIATNLSDYLIVARIGWRTIVLQEAIPVQWPEWCANLNGDPLQRV